MNGPLYLAPVFPSTTVPHPQNVLSSLNLSSAFMPDHLSYLPTELLLNLFSPAHYDSFLHSAQMPLDLWNSAAFPKAKWVAPSSGYIATFAYTTWPLQHWHWFMSSLSISYWIISSLIARPSLSSMPKMLIFLWFETTKLESWVITGN